jgi:hypothetical protein
MLLVTIMEDVLFVCVDSLEIWGNEDFSTDPVVPEQRQLIGNATNLSKSRYSAVVIRRLLFDPYSALRHVKCLRSSCYLKMRADILCDLASSLPRYPAFGWA